MEINELFKKILKDAYLSFSKKVMEDLNSFWYVPDQYFGFADLEVFSDDFFKQNYFYSRLEYYIRHYLVNPIFVNSLKNISHYEVQFVSHNMVITNKEYEKQITFEYIYKKNKEKIGVKYTDSFESTFIEKCEELNIKKVIVLDWYKTKNLNQNYKKSDVVIEYIGAYDYISNEVGEKEGSDFEIYLRNVVDEYMNFLGIASIPKLTPSKYFEHRIWCEKELVNFGNDLKMYKRFEEKGKKQQYSYKIINDYNKNIEGNINIEEDSKKIIFIPEIYDNFYKNSLYKILVGKSEISRSFLTAEYLYEAYNNKYDENEEIFDYTSIVCGYLKSIEQLLCKIILLFQDKIHPYFNNNFRIGSDNKDLTSANFKSHSLDTTLGSLIYFLENYIRYTFVVDIKVAKIIIKCLKLYKNECRNGSFHLDNNYNWDCVRKIRHNTFVLYIMLLGGLKLCDSIDETYSYFNVIRNDYLEKIYYTSRNKDCNFIIQETINSKIITARRIEDKTMPVFDEYGLFKDYKMQLKSDDKRIEVSKDNMPYIFKIEY